VAVREADSQKRRVTFVSSLRSGDPNTRRLAYNEDMGLVGSLEADAAPKSHRAAEGLPTRGYGFAFSSGSADRQPRPLLPPESGRAARLQ
jgi:hypothetical protein